MKRYAKRRINRYVKHTLSAVVFAVSGATANNSLSAQEIIRRPIAEDAVIDGIPCAKTTQADAEFYASGRLAECPLSRETKLASQTFPRGTWVILREDGVVDGAWLPQHTLLSGHECRGEGYRKWSVRFHSSGALRLCFLSETTVIDGVPCRDGTFWGEIRGGQKTAVHFHPNGRLARCQVARAFTLNGQRYAKWDVVMRDSAGKGP